jgi:hypothetical protein
MTMQRMHRASPWVGAASLSAVSLLSCGGSEPPAAAPSQDGPKAAAPPHPKKQRLSISGQLGSLDESKVEESFNRLLPKLGDCLSQGSSRVEFIGGHVKFFVRISLDGSAKWAYLPESTIGDRETERCMLGVVKAARWPLPAEGEGQAQKAFDFDPSPDIREAVAWGSDRVAKALAAARPKLDHCTQAAPGRYRATAYIQTKGTPISAGVAPPDEHGEPAAVDCIVEVIKAMRFPSPGSWPAKVVFDVD